MKTILFAVLGLVLLIGLFAFYLAYLRRQVSKLVLVKSATLKPLIRKLKSNESITGDELAALCEEPSLRPAIFHLLKVYERQDLFPSSYMTFEKGAESYLVNWLEFPTELGAKPLYIEFLTKVILIDREKIDYYVFKFMANSKDWVTHQWMIGACGPYNARSAPYDVPARVYSRFKTLETETPESEVQWIHANIRSGPFKRK